MTIALFLLAVPAAVAVPPEGKGNTKAKPAQAQGASQSNNAAKLCKAERGTTSASREAFANKYGTNGNKRNAFGKCVSQKAKQKAKERDEAEQATADAANACRAERGTTSASREAFADKYGTNANKRNAFGKCVSQKAKQTG